MFVDQSDFLRDKKGHMIEFYHVPTGKTVKFKAWVTSFADNFASEWNQEQVYGRMDPIQTFKQTTRTIDIAWEVVAGSVDEAISNMDDCQSLFKMLYPTYEGSTMKAPPLIKMRFANLIQDSSKAPSRGVPSARTSGLVGSLSGFSYTPDFDAGVFDVGVGKVYPKVVRLECTFTVMHTHKLGWEGGDWAGADGFPYKGSVMKQEGTELSDEAFEAQALDELPLEPIPPRSTSGDTASSKAREAAKAAAIVAGFDATYQALGGDE